MSKTVEMKIGRLLCGRVREYLNQARFDGYEFNYFESGGLLSHKFILRSDGDDAHTLGNDLKQQLSERGLLGDDY